MLSCSKFMAMRTAQTWSCHQVAASKIISQACRSYTSSTLKYRRDQSSPPLGRCLAFYGPLPSNSPIPNPRKSLTCNVCQQMFTGNSSGIMGGSLLFTTANRISLHRTLASASGGGAGGSGGTEDGDGNGGSGKDALSSAAAMSLGVSGSEEVIMLDVTGMRCAGCVSRVKAILEDQPPVKQASVNLATETAVIVVSMPEATSPAAVSAAPPAGLPAVPDGDGFDLEVGVPLHEQRVVAMGTDLAKLLTNKGYAASFRPRDAGTSASAKVVEAKHAERMNRLRDAARRLAFAWLLASGCLAHHMVHWLGIGSPWLHQLLGSTALHATLSAMALLGPGRQIVVDGFSSLARNAPDMNSLVGLGATAAYCMSAISAAMPQLGWPTFFEEPAMLLGVVLIGRALEERAKLQASADMAALQGLLPQRARLLLSDGVTWREVPADAITAGDLVEVLPGDRSPVDGVVVGGKSSVDESGMTGEPLPVTKTQGDQVAAGSLNYDGRLVVRATHSGGDTAVADVVRLVEFAQARSAPIQRVADEVAGKFTYGVMGAAAAAFLFWVGPGTHLFPQVLTPFAATTSKAAASLLLSLQMACNVLVVACPCALGLAAPTAVLVGTSAGARRGLLVRGGDVLESASHVNAVVFDKTGTLTMGRPTVVSTRLAEPSSTRAKKPVLDSDRMLALAGAVERGSTHPIGKAICRAAEAAGSALKVQDGSFIQEPGSGVTGIVDGHRVFVGNLEWVTAQVGAMQGEKAIAGNGSSQASAAVAGVYTPPPASTQSQSSELKKPGHILVHVGIDDKVAGSIEISDELRPDAATTVAALKRAGIKPYMLSGDQPATAQAIGASVGIDAENVFAGVKPAGKATMVEQLQSQGCKVAMVGDGVNDAAALAAADVGIAMGGGVDAASEVADIVLLGDKLPQVLDALRLSRATLATIKQNMWWAFAYNMACIPIAAGALLPGYGIALTPSMSGAMMGVSSLAVMANSLMLQQRIDSGNLQMVAPKKKLKSRAGGKSDGDGDMQQRQPGTVSA